MSRLGGNANEWTQLFVGTLGGGASRRLGAAGASHLPQGGGVAGGTGARPWMGVDFNGTYDPTSTSGSPGTATARFQLPGEGSVPAYNTFPTFNDGYGNGVPVETTTTGVTGGTTMHASVYNALYPATGNRNFSPFHAAALLRWGGNAHDTHTSDLLKLCPTNFGSTGATANKLRNLVTVLSTDLDRPGATPYVQNAADATTKYQWAAGTTHPTGQPIQFLPSAPLPVRPAASLTQPRGARTCNRLSPRWCRWHSTAGSTSTAA